MTFHLLLHISRAGWLAESRCCQARFEAWFPIHSPSCHFMPSWRLRSSSIVFDPIHPEISWRILWIRLAENSCIHVRDGWNMLKALLILGCFYHLSFNWWDSDFVTIHSLRQDPQIWNVKKRSPNHFLTIGIQYLSWISESKQIATESTNRSLRRLRSTPISRQLRWWIFHVAKSLGSVGAFFHGSNHITTPCCCRFP